MEKLKMWKYSGGSRHWVSNITCLLTPPYPSLGRPSGTSIKFSCSSFITMLLNQALVLPRTTILLLLFLTAFIWIAVSLIPINLILRCIFIHTFCSTLRSVLPSSSCRILYLPAGDLDAPPGGPTEVHHLGSLPLLPPPPRHHHLLHHPHLHHGPGQRGKFQWLLATTYHCTLSISSPANGRQRQAVRMGKNPRNKAIGGFSSQCEGGNSFDSVSSEPGGAPFPTTFCSPVCFPTSR